ncbi:GNAT family N-acetyltransferase [Streptomyces sp. NPDC055099]
MRHWPLAQLTLTTGDLVLRIPDDRQLDELAQVAADGVAPRGAALSRPWAPGPAEETARQVVQTHWKARGDWHEDNWSLLLAVFHDGEVIGEQSLSACDFRVTREAHTGFWLGQRFQRRGFGTQMRTAALGLAFDCLGAERVMTTAFAGDSASRRVSERLGYEPNGVRRFAAGHRLVEAHDTVLTADRWHRQPQQPTKAEGFDYCRQLFGTPALPPPVDVLLHV